MAALGDLSWRAQLSQVRGHVEEQEKRRENEKRLERERNEQSVAKRLKEETPEVLAQRFADIHKVFDREARKLYPLPQLENVLESLTDYADLIRFYLDCMKSFPKVFSPAHKTALPSLLNEANDLQKGLDRQIGQWREIKPVVDAVQFRPRKSGDDAALVTVAKFFSEHAHRVPLSIPADYFAHEKENFWAMDLEGRAIGYFKYLPTDKALNFAVDPGEKVNFNKCIRGLIWKFCSQGPLASPLQAARVRLGYVREVKFFTDMGLVRSEVKGPSDWIYQREVA